MYADAGYTRFDAQMKLTPTEPDVRTIVDRIDSGDIDLQPDFQRQEVWATSKKRKLIDTVLRGWSIPPVHLVETEDLKLEVLDGQQRLAALRDFIHNKFSIDGRITPGDEGVKALHGRFYKTLEPVHRRKIDQYPLRMFRITDYKPEEPSELFYRLNQPTVLTAGEQRNALFGPARQQLKDLVSIFEIEGNSKETLGFSNIRLAYDDVLARLLFFLEVGGFGVKSTESRISERFRDKNAFDSVCLKRANIAIDLFSKARQVAQPYRFNKANTLSWLLFYSRFSSVEMSNVDFMRIFLDIEATKKNYHFVYDAVSLFDDRASLRVTDVSSVVYRDFALCYVYYFVFGKPPSLTMDVALFAAVDDIVSDRIDTSFEYAVEQTIDIDAWSSTL